MTNAASLFEIEENVVNTKLQPRQGKLVSLKTKAELGAEDITVDAYVIEIPSKFANSIINLLSDAIHQKDDVDLQHLRRFAKPAFLPEHLQQRAQTNEQASDSSLTLHLLICSVNFISLPVIRTILSSFCPFEQLGLVPSISTLPVPLYPPTSEEQADRWSKQYWPTVYKRSNPFGPHPSLIARAEDELREQAGVWMALAQLTATQATNNEIGEGVGAVITDRGADPGHSAIVVAGDARWCGPSRASKIVEGSGNVMAHAVMRAIGFIAQKRLRVANTNSTAIWVGDRSPPSTLERDYFWDRPVTAVEQLYFGKDNLEPGGYLCLDLDIYITHEPCIMCSMAILHSRFGRVIFASKMPQTGGLTAEQQGVTPRTENRITSHPSCALKGSEGLGHGLFWRPELNWKLLAWQWNDAVSDWPKTVDECTQI